MTSIASERRPILLLRITVHRLALDRSLSPRGFRIQIYLHTACVFLVSFLGYITVVFSS